MPLFDTLTAGIRTYSADRFFHRLKVASELARVVEEEGEPDMTIDRASLEFLAPLKPIGPDVPAKTRNDDIS